MEVRSETGVMATREPFNVTLQKNPVQIQPATASGMRLAYTSDGTAIYTPIATNSPSPPHNYQGGGAAGTSGGSAGDGGDETSPAMLPHGSNINMGENMKRKRGRPRKFGPDGSITVAPIRVPSSAPGDPSKKGRGRPPGSRNKHLSVALGSAGIGFTPHVITVKAGEDVSSKIMSFAQQSSRAVCILSANGAISNVTLRHASTAGATVTYEGRFEILSLSGSFILTKNGGQYSRAGGLSVSLAGPDGRLFGGGVAGLLTAASPLQVVVGSFINDEKKKVKQLNPLEPTSAPAKIVPGTLTGASSPPLRGTFGESSGGPGSPPNQSIGTVHGQQALPSMPWK